MSSDNKSIGAALLESGVDLDKLSPVFSVHVENEMIQRIAQEDKSIKTETVSSCWAQSGEHLHIDGKCRFVCQECGLRIPGALGHGMPCMCGR